LAVGLSESGYGKKNDKQQPQHGGHNYTNGRRVLVGQTHGDEQWRSAATGFARRQDGRGNFLRAEIPPGEIGIRLSELGLAD
jgi:hypothetical protein